MEDPSVQMRERDAIIGFGFWSIGQEPRPDDTGAAALHAGKRGRLRRFRSQIEPDVSEAYTQYFEGTCCLSLRLDLGFPSRAHL
jgi:hypothetical protein